MSDPLLGYAIAGFGCVAALLITLAAPALMKSDPFELFMGVVFLAALYFGIGPALAASLISILVLDYFFIPPLYTLACGLTDLLRLGIFGFIATVTSSLSNRVKIMETERAVLDTSDREQRRLGQDLHDGVCQLLASAKFLIDGLKQKPVPPQTSKDLTLVETRVKEALRQADSLARGLYPVSLDSRGLCAALTDFTGKMSQRHAIRCRFELHGNVPAVGEDTSMQLFRIAQEAVMNAIKSGNAKTVKISLIHRRSRLILAVTDDGIGFKRPERDGMGLKMMEGRALVLRGAFAIRARKRGGTAVIVSVPRLSI